MKLLANMAAAIALGWAVVVPAPAEAETFYGSIGRTASGESILIYYTYVGDEPGGFEYAVYAARRSEPEGFYWFMFKNGCFDQRGRETAAAFRPWSGAPQEGRNLITILPPSHQRGLTHLIQCGVFPTQYTQTDWDAVVEHLKDFQR